MTTQEISVAILEDVRSRGSRGPKGEECDVADFLQQASAMGLEDKDYGWFVMDYLNQFFSGTKRKQILDHAFA